MRFPGPTPGHASFYLSSGFARGCGDRSSMLVEGTVDEDCNVRDGHGLEHA